MNRTYFDNVKGADLPGFLEGLHLFIASQCPIGEIGTEAAKTRGDDLIAQVAAIAGTPGTPISATLRFLAELESSGRFDQLLFGTGTIGGKTQPYSLVIQDLSTLDPFCNAVSFMRYNKGNPWFGFEIGDIASDVFMIKTFERRVRKKKTELLWSAGMNPRELQLFLWSWFNRCDAGVQFTDCPDIDDDVLSDLAKVFPVTVPFSGQGALFEAPNTYLAIYFTSLGWVASVTIPDARLEHAFTPTILRMVDITPSIIETEVARVNAALSNS